MMSSFMFSRGEAGGEGSVAASGHMRKKRREKRGRSRCIPRCSSKVREHHAPLQWVREHRGGDSSGCKAHAGEDFATEAHWTRRENCGTIGLFSGSIRNTKPLYTMSGASPSSFSFHTRAACAFRDHKRGVRGSRMLEQARHNQSSSRDSLVSRLALLSSLPTRARVACHPPLFSSSQAGA
jgi:hypothetical protein